MLFVESMFELMLLYISTELIRNGVETTILPLRIAFISASIIGYILFLVLIIITIVQRYYCIKDMIKTRK